MQLKCVFNCIRELWSDYMFLIDFHKDISGNSVFVFLSGGTEWGWVAVLLALVPWLGVYINRLHLRPSRTNCSLSAVLPTS